MCFWLRRGGVSTSLIHLLWDLWLPLGVSALVDWHSGGGVHFTTGLLRSVYHFSRWYTSTSLLSAAHLIRLCLGYVDGETSQVIPRLSKLSSSVVG
ncbi:hypothetical protein QL285_007083 [Trifolium repens]|nr:hypothetical protein QL285_007083 [Trifolium repens]